MTAAPDQFMIDHALLYHRRIPRVRPQRTAVAAHLPGPRDLRRHVRPALGARRGAGAASRGGLPAKRLPAGSVRARARRACRRWRGGVRRTELLAVLARDPRRRVHRRCMAVRGAIRLRGMAGAGLRMAPLHVRGVPSRHARALRDGVVMSNPALSNALTPGRLADLRRVATGDMRRTDGPPREIQRARLAWLARHLYVTVTPAPPRSTPAERRACVTVTERGWQAIAEDDARRDGTEQIARTA